jgi:hypothetical protein
MQAGPSAFNTTSANHHLHGVEVQRPVATIRACFRKDGIG